jgi:uncharacterized protein YecE (DUF72 family)
VLEPRHDSFKCVEFVRLTRSYGVATVFTDSEEYPNFGDVTANFVYARLMRAQASVKSGYDAAALDAWKKIACTFARGSEPKEFPRIAAGAPKAKARDVFVFFINGAKERAPAAALELLQRM